MRNKAVSEALDQRIDAFLEDHIGMVLFQPLLESRPADFDWSQDGQFSFLFHLGRRPDVDIDLSQLEGLKKKVVEINDDHVEDLVQSLRKSKGKTDTIETIEDDEKVMCHIRIREKDDERGEILEGGLDKMKIIDFSTAPREFREFLSGKSADGDAYDATADQLGGKDRLGEFLELEEDVKDDLNDQFSIDIQTAVTFKLADMDQEFFDSVFGVGEVETEEQFREKIREQMATDYDQKSDKWLYEQYRQKLLEAVEFDLPQGFLYKYLHEQKAQEQSDEQNKVSREEVVLDDGEYEEFFENVRWSVISQNLSERYDVQVDDEEVQQQAIREISQQYGSVLQQVSEEQRIQFFRSMLSNQNLKNRVRINLIDWKTFQEAKAELPFEQEVIDKESFDELNNNKPTDEAQEEAEEPEGNIQPDASTGTEAQSSDNSGQAQ